MSYTANDLDKLKSFYQQQLLRDTLPFWFPRSVDTEHGGFLLMRDADGSLIDDDKAVWIQGRATWLLSTLYNSVDKNSKWIDHARQGYDFLNRYCFDDSDGRMFFHVTRDGKPIRKRRYFFSETFYVIASAAYATATGDADAARRAREVFGDCIAYARGEKKLPPKFTDTRPSKGIGVPMIMMNTAQQLRETIGDDRCDPLIMNCIDEIERYFVKDDIRCVMEQVAKDGSIIDHIDGRTLNPGHAIEAAWFILMEAKHRKDQRLTRLGCRILDYMWERGWDREHGGIFYFRDVYGKPVQEYWQDMKFWWPHNEAIVATLLAYLMTGDQKYAEWHKTVHEYSYSHFHDKVHGEWFGYLHRDGTVAQSAKGNLFKGPFHLPRQELYCWKMLEQHLAK